MDVIESWNDGGEKRLVEMFFFSSRRRHTRYWRDWSSDVCSSDLDKEYLPLKVIKKRIEGGGGFTAGDSAGDLSRVLEERTYTREELADTLETEIRFVEELVSVGVIGRSGELTQRDAEIARMALEMAKYSIQPRHLRGIMAAVDREAALFKQVLNPDLRSGDDGRVGEAMNKARHLAAVDSRIKELMMANVLDTFSP